MLHLILHVAVPLVVALAFYRSSWRQAAVILIATMLVDLDHLVADPIYDPERCSIGFHPLHTLPAILLYTLLFVVPLAWKWKVEGETAQRRLHVLHLVGLGLLIHMALDALDCIV